ncbi:MAG TPA: OmpH family outer membrane protein, partial [Phycisphaerales bacterium]|nr:OmpH family outer membrane protein [Phycisphaerales bacterium]
QPPASVARSDQRLATVNMFHIVEKMVQSERYRPARETMMKEFQTRLEAAKREIESLYNEIMQAGQDSDKGRALIPQFQTRQREAQQLEEELQVRAGEFNTQQLAEAYRLATETVAMLAKQGGYTHVLSTRGVASEPIRGTNVAAAVQEIMARPVVVFPEADDLTERAITELQLTGVTTDEGHAEDSR